MGNLRTRMTTGQEIQCTAQASKFHCGTDLDTAKHSRIMSSCSPQVSAGTDQQA